MCLWEAGEEGDAAAAFIDAYLALDVLGSVNSVHTLPPSHSYYLAILCDKEHHPIEIGYPSDVDSSIESDDNDTAGHVRLRSPPCPEWATH
ncbi:hypothetical protein A3I56_00775 [Candidatus Roizmanbacteria bacterium RIFCSPLOWO2_02_FULL_43_10]|uniref:Uncharacterized protein n=1 Tax=Candidatus Roizmanbacteria bacterium RIFCSPLOWO2_02_FULL_43_10 TaxID=1802078 RepID=A0A1F7JVW6_9BACT|nr:MAG: hypothetical protein A3I56_00775 [Candidatus Roizmanbacteria bacterium RIFCSPLOWO2_02_FULL_43_10]